MAAPLSQADSRKAFGMAEQRHAGAGRTDAPPKGCGLLRRDRTGSAGTPADNPPYSAGGPYWPAAEPAATRR